MLPAEYLEIHAEEEEGKTSEFTIKLFDISATKT